MRKFWRWCNRESKASWKALLHRVTESTVVVTDGGTGLRSALSELWPHARIQRCFFIFNRMLLDIRLNIQILKQAKKYLILPMNS